MSWGNGPTNTLQLDAGKQSKRCPWNMAAIRAVIHEKGYLQQLLRMDAQRNGELLIP